MGQGIYVDPARDFCGCCFGLATNDESVAGTRSGRVLGPEQRITPYEGLQAITINGAYMLFEDGDKGSLEPGKLADLVILDHNPLKVEPAAIKDIKVMETIKAGKPVFMLGKPLSPRTKRSGRAGI